MKKLLSPGNEFIVVSPPFPKPQASAHEPWKIRTWDTREFPDQPVEYAYAAAAWTLKNGHTRVYWYNAVPTANVPDPDPHNVVDVFNVCIDMATPDWPHTGKMGGNYYNSAFRGREVNIEP